MHPILRGFPRGLLHLPPRRTLWRIDGLQAPTGRWGEPELIVSRGLCRFGRFDLSRLPAAKRASALSLQLPGWSPFAESDGVVAWTEDGHASVWCWDRAALVAAWGALEQGQDGKLPRRIPETCLYGATGDGLRLLSGIEGFEAQHWVAGELLASRWWPALPDAAAQLAFQRDCGLPADAQRAQLPIETPAMAVRPWAPLSVLGADSGRLAASELLGYALLTVVLGLPALSLAVDQWRLYQARSSAEAELANETARSQDVSAARNEALTAAEQARALVELQPYPGPLVHMLAIARALPDSGGSILREWEQTDGKLRLLVVSSATDIVGADHVRALEQTGLFSDVKILTQADPRQMAFSMSLKPQAALALSVASSSSSASSPTP
jgi:hypothetical protein